MRTDVVFLFNNVNQSGYSQIPYLPWTSKRLCPLYLNSYSIAPVKQG